MSYSGARDTFERAKSQSEDMGVRLIAEGLQSLARAIESDINKLEREIQTIKNRVNSMRG